MGVPLQVGELVGGKYRLERQIGQGGMGVVYAAMHIHLHQRVALKFLIDDAAKHADLVERFWREARTAVKIQSEHVARVLDIAQLDDKSPYIVMEYLEGDDLETLVERSGPLAVGDAIRYVLQACEAVAEMHVQGMVHRDIKPANLFLATRPDGTNIVKLLDFGITKAAPAWTENDSLTNTAAVIGSPRYMAPEQLRNARDVDPRADVWALGVTLFELLGGQSPFSSGTMPEVCASILKDEPKSLTGLRSEVPMELTLTIRRCLEKEPNSRYPNVADLARALRPFGPRGIIDISIERIVGMQKRSTGELPVFKEIKKTPPTGSQVVARAPTAHEAKTVAAPVAVPAAKPVEPAKPLESEKHYTDRIGPGRQIPRIAMKLDELNALALDHRTGFMLSLVDGNMTIDELLDVSGMPRIEALRILCELLDHGALSLTPPHE